MRKIKEKDSLETVILKLAEGNAKAVFIIMLVFNVLKGQVDDRNIHLILLSLDKIEMYGSNICDFFNDECNRDVKSFLTKLEAKRIEFIKKEKRIQQLKLSLNR